MPARGSEIAAGETRTFRRRWSALSRVAAVSGVGLVLLVAATGRPTDPRELLFIVTADAHYGITRPVFRGARSVDAHVVNAALVAAMNGVSMLRFPADGGVGAGRLVGPVDFVAELGDVTNREEATDEAAIQPARASWAQFVGDYLEGMQLRDRAGGPTPLFVVPGNHEASNAVGFYKHMSPATDATPLIEIYNRMMRPRPVRTAASFDYQRDRVYYSRDLGGIHFVFLHVWPDSAMRARMERDLAEVSSATPVMIVTHDQPDVQSKHFINPNGAHDVNAVDRFENLLADQFADGPTVDVLSLVEQAEFEAFLQRHPNVTAYFHGNSNWHEVYDWNGPHGMARLHTVRVDSPMKGAVSSVDETRLSFAVVKVDLARRIMTVRECLWNAVPAHPDAAAWGAAVTSAFEPRPDAR